MENTRNDGHPATLIIGLAIPVLMVIVIALAIHLPRWLSPHPDPATDFLYSVGSSHEITYHVDQGKLIRSRSDQTDPLSNTHHPRLYLHDVSANSSREISWERAQRLELDPRRQSPDGYELIPGTKPGWLILDHRKDWSRRFLVKGHKSVEQSVVIPDTGYYHGASLRLLGWVASGAEQLSDG